MPTKTPEKPVSDQEFEQLYRENYDPLLRYAATLFKLHGSQYVSASGRAEEAVQELFALAWERRDKLAAAPNSTAWLYSALQYKVREFLREDRVWTKRVLQVSEQYQTQDTSDFRLKLELKDMLPLKDYSLLKWLYLDGYTYTEVCEMMGLKKSALAMRVKRIKEAFMSEYDANEKFSHKKCEQSPPGGHYIVEEVHGDGT